MVLADINQDMLDVGRDKLHDKGLHSAIDFVQANAECLPFGDNQFNVITIAFGLRNVTDKNKALRSMFRVCKTRRPTINSGSFQSSFARLKATL